MLDAVVLSVMGPHAGESEEAIFVRKQADIAAIGRTFWLYRSHFARPDHVQLTAPTAVIFIESATKNGARSTTIADCAHEVSADNASWTLLPDGISPVTGKLGAYAFVFSEIATVAVRTLDLWEYTDASGEPIRFRLGASTVIAKRGAVVEGAKSRYRRVLAVGTLVEPKAVWIR